MSAATTRAPSFSRCTRTKLTMSTLDGTGVPGPADRIGLIRFQPSFCASQPAAGASTLQSTLTFERRSLPISSTMRGATRIRYVVSCWAAARCCVPICCDANANLVTDLGHLSVARTRRRRSGRTDDDLGRASRDGVGRAGRHASRGRADRVPVPVLERYVHRLAGRVRDPNLVPRAVVMELDMAFLPGDRDVDLDRAGPGAGSDDERSGERGAEARH